MKIIYFWLSFALLLGARGDTEKPSILRCKPNFSLAERLLTSVVKGNPRLAAGFIRAAFHDCITTRPNKKGSGCNGSLRLRVELDFGQNGGLHVLMNKIEPVLRKTCISTADAIQMGVEISLKLTGGPDVFLGRNRVDAIKPDPLEGELPGLDDFDTLKAFYKRKGMNVREMVVSNVGGHSLGKFFGFNFSPNPNRFDNLYAVNLLHHLDHGESLPGFNTLSSDRALISKPEGLFWIKFYADMTPTGRFTRGLENLRQDFARFLKKQSSL